MSNIASESVFLVFGGFWNQPLPIPIRLALFACGHVSWFIVSCACYDPAAIVVLLMSELFEGTMQLFRQVLFVFYVPSW